MRINPLSNNVTSQVDTEMDEETIEEGVCPICDQRMKRSLCQDIQVWICLEHRIVLPVSLDV